MSRGLFPETDLLRALVDKMRGRPARARAHRPAPYVGANDTIGSPDCWCGRPGNHDWPMKEIGAAHPRWATQ
jgi:hypothetical protein